MIQNLENIRKNIPEEYPFNLFRSSPSKVFLGKGVLKICSKFTGEHPCQSAISIKLLSTLAWVFSRKFAVYFQNTFS